MGRVASTLATGALACACVVVAGCGTAATGARREGPAPAATRVKTPSTVAPAIVADQVALATMVRKDNSVSADVREDLTPCVGAGYPMDTDSGDLTAGDGPDLVINVTTCGDGLGIAAYVYRMVNGKYQNVFADEQPPVYGSVEDGRLQIIHEVYRTDDPATYPTGQESITYAWRGQRFVEVARDFSDFGARTPTVSPEPTSTDPAPLPKSDPVDPGVPAAETTTPAPAKSPSSGVSGRPSSPAAPGSTAPQMSADGDAVQHGQGQ
ncbi:hypothetical protein [Streptomyces sp. NPDC008317]|uniref:hypothetical protein n=1 Tax=Streptomyces sp. NPDC008317 TaxID=3364827 RepID=UPI0036F0DD6F